MTPVPVTAPVVGNQQVALFDQLIINNDAIDRAKSTSLYWRGASVGNNISFGLDCLADNVNAYINGQRKSSCGTGFYNSRFSRDNWIYVPFTAGSWQGKATEFKNTINSRAPRAYDWVTFKYCYLEGLPGSGVVSGFYSGSPSIASLESLNADHPIFWMTMALARNVGTSESTGYNDELRNFITVNKYPLFDLADIESHYLNGNPCLDSSGYPIICAQYTDEINGGHLNPLGSNRLAKAFWVFMAEMAGWRPKMGGVGIFPEPERGYSYPGYLPTNQEGEVRDIKVNVRHRNNPCRSGGDRQGLLV